MIITRALGFDVGAVLIVSVLKFIRATSYKLQIKDEWSFGGNAPRAENFFRVSSCLLQQILLCNAHDLSYPACDQRNIGRLISFSTVRNRCEIRTIGLHNNMIHAYPGQHLVQTSILECCHSTNAEIKSHLYDCFCLVRRPAETMEYSRKVLPRMR